LLNDLAARLLPSPLQVETLTLEDHGLTLDVKVTTPTAPCPTCAQSDTRIHSDYRRTLADLPWATRPVCHARLVPMGRVHGMTTVLKAR